MEDRPSPRPRRVRDTASQTAAQAPVERLLTPDEVCAMLRVRKEWLYAQVQRRQLPAIRLNGRSLRFKRDDVQAYIDRQYGHVG